MSGIVVVIAAYDIVDVLVAEDGLSAKLHFPTVPLK